jgi:hypothetical protein
LTLGNVLIESYPLGFAQKNHAEKKSISAYRRASKKKSRSTDMIPLFFVSTDIVYSAIDFDQSTMRLLFLMLHRMFATIMAKLANTAYHYQLIK